MEKEQIQKNLEQEKEKVIEHTKKMFNNPKISVLPEHIQKQLSEIQKW